MTDRPVCPSRLILADHDLDALRAFAAAHGRCWKSHLRRLWSSGRDVGELRRLRNVLGPSGLARISVRPLAA